MRRVSENHFNSSDLQCSCNFLLHKFCCLCYKMTALFAPFAGCNKKAIKFNSDSSYFVQILFFSLSIHRLILDKQKVLQKYILYETVPIVVIDIKPKKVCDSSFSSQISQHSVSTIDTFIIFFVYM